MANNYIQEGKTLTYSNATGSAIAAGDLVIVGQRVGVALVDIADGASGAVAVEGVYEVAKEASLSVSQGDLLYCDATSGELDKTETDHTLAGYAFADSASSETTVKVKLNG